jgi:hypothetical protein
MVGQTSHLGRERVDEDGYRVISGRTLRMRIHPPTRERG